VFVVCGWREEAVVGVCPCTYLVHSGYDIRFYREAHCTIQYHTTLSTPLEAPNMPNIVSQRSRSIVVTSWASRYLLQWGVGDCLHLHGPQRAPVLSNGTSGSVMQGHRPSPTPHKHICISACSGDPHILIWCSSHMRHTACGAIWGPPATGWQHYHRNIDIGPSWGGVVDPPNPGKNGSISLLWGLSSANPRHWRMTNGLMWDTSRGSFHLGGPAQDLSNFQMAPIPILSVLTCSTS
jgi:hypothetical protein